METPPVRHLWVADEKFLHRASVTQSDALDPYIVNNHQTLSMPNTEKEKLLTDDIKDYMEKIRELNERLDMVKKMVKPGCSHEVLNTALFSLSSLARILSQMPQKLRASL